MASSCFSARRVAAGAICIRAHGGRLGPDLSEWRAGEERSRICSAAITQPHKELLHGFETVEVRRATAATSAAFARTKIPSQCR